MTVETQDAPSGAAVPARPFVSLFAIARVFMAIGAMSFGGGITGWVYRDVVLKKHWMSEADFLSGLALAQALPGGNVTNLSVYVGNWLRGVPGAVTALCSILLVPALSVLVFLAFYAELSGLNWVQAGLGGAAAAAIGLLILVAWKTAWEIRGSVTGLIIMALTFGAIVIVKLPFIAVVAVVAPISIAIAWPRKPPDAQ